MEAREIETRAGPVKLRPAKGCLVHRGDALGRSVPSGKSWHSVRRKRHRRDDAGAPDRSLVQRRDAVPHAHQHALRTASHTRNEGCIEAAAPAIRLAPKRPEAAAARSPRKGAVASDRWPGDASGGRHRRHQVDPQPPRAFASSSVSPSSGPAVEAAAPLDIGPRRTANQEPAAIEDRFAANDPGRLRPAHPQPPGRATGSRHKRPRRPQRGRQPTARRTRRRTTFANLDRGAGAKPSSSKPSSKRIT